MAVQTFELGRSTTPMPVREEGTAKRTERAMSEELRRLVHYAAHAPSSHNTQPWRFRIQDDSLLLYADTSRQLLVADPDRRELFLSAGCALETLVIAARHFGLQATVAYDGTDAGAEALVPVASLRFTRGAAADDDVLFRCISRRHTPRGDFRSTRVPHELATRLMEAALAHESRLVLTDEDDDKRAAAALAEEAERAQFARPDFRRELGKLVGAGAFGTPRPFSWLAGLMVSRLDLGERYAKAARERVSKAPALGFLLARLPPNHGEAPPWEWREAIVRTGRAYQRIALLADAQGRAVQPVSEPIQNAGTRERLAELARARPEELMMFFRVGTPLRPPRRRSPRRHPDQLIAT